MFENIRTKELADCIGKTNGFASQIKHGHRGLPKKYLLVVSERFGIPLEKLCAEEQPITSDPTETSS